MVLEQLTLNTNATILISLALMLLCGFLSTRITKRLKLPNVTGYIIVGILIGPYILNIIPTGTIAGMDFVTDIALAFIAFGVGRYLKLSVLKQNSKQIIIITLCEALLAAIIVTLTMIYIFKLPISFSVLLGAIGSATAPASTIMTIRQYKAKGNFVNTLLQVVALDDAVALIAFSICTAIVRTLVSEEVLRISIILLPLLINLIAISLGILAGFILDKLISSRRSRDNRLILAIAMLLAITGFCAAFNISPLLSCMAMGIAYINLSGNKELFRQINQFAPPTLILFFVLAGMKLSIPVLLSTGGIGVAYFLIRIIGKYIGSFIGASLSGAPMEVRKYLGLALVPQAGVSIGLAILGQRILPTDMGILLSTIILSSSVLYELIGPISAKVSLHLSNSIPSEDRKGA